jgi:hypothetical protein
MIKLSKCNRNRHNDKFVHALNAIKKGKIDSAIAQTPMLETRIPPKSDRG